MGAQKCGTTTLHKSLVKHRGLRGPVDPVTSAKLKEVNFFHLHWERGLEWYDSMFESGAGPILDSTPNYLCYLPSHQRMAEAFPDARIVVTLRDPIARAYSAYNHYIQDYEEAQHWDWARPGENFAANVKAELERDCADPRSTLSFVGRGRYAIQLEHLFKFYPREQVRVVVLERWSRDPVQLASAVLSDLGLKAGQVKDRTAHQREKTVEPLDTEIHHLLQEHYRPHHQQLEELLGESIPEWSAK